MSVRNPICLTLLLTATATPAAAALPRLVESGLDYLLMPLLGYLSLVVIGWLLELPLRLRGNRD